MIRATRADVLAHLARHRIEYAEDPSNTNPRFLRTRVRRELMPLLEELSPGIVRSLCSLADELAKLAPAELPGPDGRERLGRAQRALVERAVRLSQRGAKVRLKGGRELAAMVLSRRTGRA